MKSDARQKNSPFLRLKLLFCQASLCIFGGPSYVMPLAVQKGHFKKYPYAAGNCTQILLTMSVVKVKLFSTSAGASKRIPRSIIECFTLDLVPVVERGIAFTRTGFIVE